MIIQMQLVDFSVRLINLNPKNIDGIYWTFPS